MYGDDRLLVHLCLLFNIFIKYSYLPQKFMSSVIVPVVKNKTGDLLDVNNYRAIAVSNAISKLFESVLLEHVVTAADGDEFQFGFKSGHSTSIGTSIMKKTVDYYTNRGSHVFCCFLDFGKAFHKVNYWKLFDKLQDDGINSKIVRTLMFWYSHQQMCVRWHSMV